MKLAVLGGSGFLGRALVERLVSTGHEVTVLTRQPEHAAPHLPVGARAALFLSDRPLESHGLAGADAVVNLAGAPVAQRWTRSHKEEILKSRVDTTRALVQAAQAAGTVKALVNASAIGYYGTSRAGALTEDSPPGSDFLAQVCVAWEKAAAQAERFGIRAAWVRLGVVLHPGGGALKPLVTQFRLGTGGVVGTGRQVLSWIHRDDAVALFAYALEHGEMRGPFNGTAPTPVAQEEFAHALGRALHRPAALHIPGLVLRATLGEMAQVLLEGQRVLPERTQAAGFTFAYPELDGALAALFAHERPSPHPAPPGSAASRP